MQPRSLQQILSELDSTYNPQVDQIRQRQAQIPGQIQAEEQGLQAKQTNAFGDILSGARQRGLGFSGIPLAEQAKYTASEYLPAVARLKQSGREQAMSLEDAILGIQERKNTLGQQIYSQDLDRAQAARQAASQSNAFGSLFGGNTNTGNVQGAQTVKSATASKRADGGFNFTDASGRPISAAAYAAAKGVPFRELLSTLAKQGDTGAKTALGFVGDDYGYDAKKITSQSLADLYNSLVWGTGKQASYRAPKKAPVGLPAGPTISNGAGLASLASRPMVTNPQNIQSFYGGR